MLCWFALLLICSSQTANAADNNKAKQATSVIRAWLLKEHHQSNAGHDLLSSLDEHGLLPLKLKEFSDSEKETIAYQDFWQPLMLTVRDLNLSWAAFELLMNIENITGNNLVHFNVLMASLSDCVGYAKWNLNEVWPGSAHEKLIMLSRDELPGSFSNRYITIREYSWQMRLRGYGDEMTRDEALTLGLWRNDTLIDIYHERYLMVWLVLTIGCVPFIIARKQHPLQVISSTFAIAVLIPAVIYFSALVASIGHNNANTRGYLKVLEMCFPFYALLVAAFCLIAISQYYLRLVKKGNHSS